MKANFLKIGNGQGFAAGGSQKNFAVNSENQAKKTKNATNCMTAYFQLE